MSWNYRVVKTTEKDGEDLYGVHEVHHDAEGKPQSLTVRALFVSGSLEGLKAVHEQMISRAFTEPVLEYPGSFDHSVGQALPPECEGEDDRHAGGGEGH